MSSSCRIKYRDDIMKDAKSIIKKRMGTSIIQDDLAIIPFNTSEKITTRAQALMLARELREQINNKYSANKFGAVAFVDNSQEEGVVINLAVPSLLLDAFEVKYGQKELSQIGEQQTLDLQEKPFEQQEQPVKSSVKSDMEVYNKVMNTTKDEVEQLKENCE